MGIYHMGIYHMGIYHMGIYHMGIYHERGCHLLPPNYVPQTSRALSPSTPARQRYIPLIRGHAPPCCCIYPAPGLDPGLDPGPHPAPAPGLDLALGRGWCVFDIEGLVGMG